MQAGLIEELIGDAMDMTDVSMRCADLWLSGTALCGDGGHASCRRIWRLLEDRIEPTPPTVCSNSWLLVRHRSDPTTDTVRVCHGR